MTRLIALLVLGLLVVVGAAAVDASHAQAGQQFSHTDESWSPDAGNVTTLNNSNLGEVVYDAHVTVKDENGTEMVDGTDYEWYQSNGTVKALSGERLDGDSSATINYGYSAPTETQNNLAALFSNLFEVQSFLLLVLGAGLVLAAMRVLGGV